MKLGGSLPCVRCCAQYPTRVTSRTSHSGEGILEGGSRLREVQNALGSHSPREAGWPRDRAGMTLLFTLAGCPPRGPGRGLITEKKAWAAAPLPPACALGLGNQLRTGHQDFRVVLVARRINSPEPAHTGEVSVRVWSRRGEWEPSGSLRTGVHLAGSHLCVSQLGPLRESRLVASSQLGGWWGAVA